jgi:hypothetical protein
MPWRCDGWHRRDECFLENTVSSTTATPSQVSRKPTDDADGVDANAALSEVALMAVATFRPPPGDPKLTSTPLIGERPMASGRGGEAPGLGAWEDTITTEQKIIRAKVGLLEDADYGG